MNEPTIVAAQPAAAADGHWLTRQHALALVLVSLTVIAIYLCFRIVQPFLAPLAWAVALAVIAHPVHTWIERRVRQPELAAGLSVALVALVLLLPSGFVVHRLALEATNHLKTLEENGDVSQWRQTIGGTAGGHTIIWLDERFDLVGQARGVVQGLTGSVLEVLKNSAWTLMFLLITLYTLFYLFRDRHAAREAVRSLVPLSYRETDEVFGRVKDTIYATLYGTLAVALIQGFLGGLIFWWLGLPAPTLWGVVMGLLAIVPNLGTFVIWAPTAAYLALSGHTTSALILAGWGLTAIALIDNITYPMLVGSRLRMHSLPVFFAILGGLIVFGPAGVILGPVVFALTEALIDIWRRRTAFGQAAEAGVKN